MSAAQSAPDRRRLFREAAVQAHRQGNRPGQPLHIVTTWTRWASGVTVMMVIAALLFAMTARVSVYAEGLAVVRSEGRMAITSAMPGTIQSVEVRPGERVEAGQVLVRLDDAVQRAELSRVEREYQLRLVELLRVPADETRRERLAALDTQRQSALARLREREIVARHSGRISDIRVRVGQPIDAGDAIVSVEDDGPHAIVVGLFPGSSRPLLDAAETRLFLEFDGFVDSRHEVQVRSVADEVIGPEEAMRYLGRDRQGALELRGSVVVVEARLPSEVFVADDVEYRVYDGMQGTLEAKVRSDTLLEILVPALKRL